MLLFSTIQTTGTRYSDALGATYLDENGVPTASYDAIRYVRVTLSGYQFRIYIPLLGIDFAVRPFSSTLPRESLGVPKYGAPAACY